MPSPLSALALLALLPAIHGQACTALYPQPADGSNSSDVGSSTFHTYAISTNNTGCVTLPFTNLGDNLEPNTSISTGTAIVNHTALQETLQTDTAQDCCAACAAATNASLVQANNTAKSVPANTAGWGFNGCNMWNWCGSSVGCCPFIGGCNNTVNISQYSYKTCNLKFSLALVNASYSNYPPAYYSQADVAVWDLPGSTANPNPDARVANSATAFTSGLYVRTPANASAPYQQPGNLTGFDRLEAQAITGQDIVCPESVDYGSLPASCHILGNLTTVTAACLNKPECTGFLFQPYGCCQNTTQSSAWLKNGNINESCTAVQPYATSYVLTDPKAAEAAYLPQKPSGGSNTGAIVGGVVGGVVGALLLAVAAWLIAVRYRTGRWTYKPGARITGPPERKGSDKGRAIPGSSLEDGSGLIGIGAPDSSGTAGTTSTSGALRKGLLPRSFGSSRGSAEGSGRSSWPDENSREPDGTQTLERMKKKAESVGPKQLWEIKPEELQILKNAEGEDFMLGSGGYGTVYKAVRDQTDTVAVKILKGKQDQRTTQAFIKEVQILSSARHPNILQFMGVCAVNGRTMLVTEFCEGGDLWNALAQHQSEWCWNNRGKRVALDVARALSYLHSRERRVCHLDVKSSNILITDNGAAKLADVGLARVFSVTKVVSKDETSGVVGTYNWAAPEALLGLHVDERSDIYSLGVVFWEICTQEIPQRGRLRELSVPDECPQVVADLIWSMCDQDPAMRPTAKQIVATLTAL